MGEDVGPALRPVRVGGGGVDAVRGDAEEVGEDEETLFSRRDTKPVAVATATPTDPTRLWTDDTGMHQIRGRVAQVLPGHVRILKENGRYTTVPFSRLSEADLAFVKSLQ